MEPNYVNDAWAIGTRFEIPFNYVYDPSLDKWIPQKVLSGGTFNSILQNPDDGIHKFGNNPNVNNTVSDDNPQTIWDGTGQYVFPPDGGTGVQVESSNNSDNQSIIIQGLDTGFNEQFWSGNLSGTGVVDLTGSWSRIFRAYNNDSTSFSGDINIHASGNSALSYAKMLDGNNQTLMGVYTVPADTTGYLMEYHLSAQNTASSSKIGFTTKMKTREFEKTFRVKEIDSVGTDYQVSKTSVFPDILPPRTDILFDVVSSNGNNGSVNVDFSIALLR